MVLIVNTNPTQSAAIAEMLERFDARLKFETSSNCGNAWLIARACKPWLVICECRAPEAFEFRVRVREHLPEAYFVFSGQPDSDAVFGQADGVAPVLSFEKLAPHFRAARGRYIRKRERSTRKKDAAHAADTGTAAEIEITVGTGDLRFTMTSRSGIRLEQFLSQLGKQKVGEVRAFRGEELLESNPDTVLEDGDRLELQAD